MALSALPALSVKQPDIGNALMKAEVIKSSRTRNALAERKIAQDEALQAATGAAAQDLASPNALATVVEPATGETMTPKPGALPPSVVNLIRLPGGAERAQSLLGIVHKAEDRQRAEIQRQYQDAGRLAIAYLDAPEERKSAAYASVMQIARKRGLPIDGLPQEWTPETAPQIEQALQTVVREGMAFTDLMKQRESFSLKPGETRFGPDGKPIASVPKERVAQLTPEEVKAAGLPAGTVAQRAADGKITVVDRPRESDVNVRRLVDGGVPRNIAEGIVAGRYTVSRDPVSQIAQVVDKATGQIVFDGQGGATTSAPGAAQSGLPPLGTEVVGKTPEGRPIIKNPDGSHSTERSITVQADGKWVNIPSMFGGKQVSQEEAVRIMRDNDWVDPETGRKMDFYDTVEEAERAAAARSDSIVGIPGTTQGAAPADTGPANVPPETDMSAGTGGSGFVGNIANTIADAIGADLPAPQAERAAQALTNLQVRTQTAMQASVPGRPSNYLMEQLGKLSVTPNSLLQGDQRAKERLRQTRDMLREETMRMERDILGNARGFTPKQIAETRANLSQLNSILRNYEAVLENFKGGDPSQGPQQAPAAGTVEDGYRFKGGDPADPNSWIKVE